MTDPVYSPDGKFMWTGTDWIPAPPTAESEPAAPSEQALNMQDSVIGGDVVHSTVINNDPAAVTTAVIAMVPHSWIVAQIAIIAMTVMIFTIAIASKIK